MKHLMVLAVGAIALAACESPPVTDSRLQGSGNAGASSRADAQSGRSGVGVTGGATAADSLQAANAQLVSVGDRVYFDTDRYDLRSDARTTLDKQALYLRQVRHRVVVEGHADERGTREYNLALAERRARSVKDYLVNQGLGADRITTISYGKERLVALGGGEDSWSKNRRSVTVLVE